MKNTTTITLTDTGLAPGYDDTPATFCSDAALPATSGGEPQEGPDFGLANGLESSIDHDCADAQLIFRGALNKAVLLGCLLAEAKYANKNRFTRMFGKPGAGFAFSYEKARLYMNLAATVVERARAAGVLDDLHAQLQAAAAARNAALVGCHSLPALDMLVNKKWVSLHQAMVDLKVMNPRPHRKALGGEAPKAAEGLLDVEGLRERAWRNTADLLGQMRVLVEHDFCHLRRQQREQLRRELADLLHELEAAEAAAPALD